MMKNARYTDKLIISCKIWGFHSTAAEDSESPTVCGCHK